MRIRKGLEDGILHRQLMRRRVTSAREDRSVEWERFTLYRSVSSSETGTLLSGAFLLALAPFVLLVIVIFEEYHAYGVLELGPRKVLLDFGIFDL